MYLCEEKKRIRTKIMTAALSGEGAALLCAFLYQRVYTKQRFGMLLLFLFLSNVTVMSVYDLIRRKIPDRCHIYGMGITAAAFFSMSEIGWEERIIGAAMIGTMMWLAVLLLPGVFGGGDLKLMLVSGIFFGDRWITDIFFYAVTAGAGYALLLIFRGKKGNEGLAMAPFFELGMIVKILIDY